MAERWLHWQYGQLYNFIILLLFLLQAQVLVHVNALNSVNVLIPYDYSRYAFDCMY